MKSQLKNNDVVICESHEQWERIKKLAIAAGMDPCYREDWCPGRCWTQCGDNNIQGWRLPEAKQRGNVMSEHEFVAKMFGVWNNDPVIIIDNHSVEFMDGGDIKVGCMPVPYDTLKAIYEHATTKL